MLTIQYLLGSWIWAITAAKTRVTHVLGLIRYASYTQRSSPVSPTPEVPASNCKMQTARTAEKVYHINDRGRVLKRSLKQDEYYILSNGERLVPPLVVERLQNEAACMEFVRKHTNIPVPKLLNTYEEDGSYHLWMEFIDGVEMNELTEREQTKLFPQIQNIITTLQTFRSKYSGGPTGILSPPPTVYFHHFSKWKQLFSPEEEFVFCHGDLSQGNILVNRETLCIVAIIDWEYSGFFPREHELPFYKSSKRSGEQVKGKELRPYVDRIIEFWRQSQGSASYKPTTSVST